MSVHTLGTTALNPYSGTHDYSWFETLLLYSGAQDYSWYRSNIISDDTGDPVRVKVEYNHRN